MGFKLPRPKPEGEDYVRAVGYFLTIVWAVVFYKVTPVAFIQSLQGYVLLLLLAVPVIGALLAIAGSVTRIDVKLEMPGILIMSLGLIAYSASQFYFATVPTESVPDPTQRYALAAYTLLPIAYLAPRAWGLLRVAHKAAKHAKQMARLAKGAR